MRSARRRQMIANAAKTIFASKGYRAATMDDISKACGIAHRTLYLHFKNKQEIFHTLMLDILDQIQALMEPARPDDLDHSASNRDAWFSITKERNLRIFQSVLRDRDLFRIILREAPGLDSEVDAVLERINSVMLRQIETELIIAQRMGLHKRTDTKLAAQMVLGTMLVVIVVELLQGSPSDLESLAERVTEVQQFGTCGKPATAP